MELDRIPSLDEFENQETNESVAGTTATVTDKDGKGEYVVTLDKEGTGGVWDASIKEITKNEHDYNIGDVLKVKAGNTHGTYWGMITESVDSLLKSIEADDGKIETEEVEAIFKGKKEKNLHVYTDKVRNPNPWGLETVSSNGRRGYIIPLDESDLEPEVMELMEGIDMEQDRAKWNAALQVYNKIGHDKIADKQAVSNAIKGIKLDIDPQVVLDTFKGVNTSLSKKDSKTLEKAKKTLGRGNSDTEKLMLAMIDNMSEVSESKTGKDAIDTTVEYEGNEWKITDVEDKPSGTGYMYHAELVSDPSKKMRFDGLDIGLNEGIELHHYKDRLPKTPKTDTLPFDDMDAAIEKAEEISKSGEYAEIFQDGKLIGHAFRGSKFYDKTNEDNSLGIKDPKGFKAGYLEALGDIYLIKPGDKDEYGNTLEKHVDDIVDWLNKERGAKGGVKHAMADDALIGIARMADAKGAYKQKIEKQEIENLISTVRSMGRFYEEVQIDEASALNLPKEADMTTKRGGIIIKSLAIGDVDRAFDIMSKIADSGKDNEWADAKKVYQGFNDELNTMYKDYNQQLGLGDMHKAYESDDTNESSLDSSMWTGRGDSLKEKLEAYEKAGLTQEQADFIEKVTHGGDSGVSFRQKMDFLATITDDDKSEIDWAIKSWDRNMIKANNDTIKMIKIGARRANENNENDIDMNESIKDLGAIKKLIKDTFGFGDDQKSIHIGDLSTMYPDATEEEIKGAVELLKGDGWAIEESEQIEESKEIDNVVGKLTADAEDAWQDKDGVRVVVDVNDDSSTAAAIKAAGLDIADLKKLKKDGHVIEWFEDDMTLQVKFSQEFFDKHFPDLVAESAEGGEGAENANEEVYTMSDGFNWNMLSKDDAKKAWKKGEEVFGINKDEETEHLIETEADFNDWDYFGQEGVNEAYEGSHGSNGNGGAENTDEANPVDTKNLFDVSAEVYDKLPYEQSSDPAKVKQALADLGYNNDDTTVKMVTDTIDGVKNESLNESKSRFGGLDHSSAPLPMFESFQGARGQKPSKKVFENAAKSMVKDLKIMDALDKPLAKLVDAAARAFKDIKDSEMSDVVDNFWTGVIDLRHELGDRYNEFVDKVNAEMAKA